MPAPHIVAIVPARMGSSRLPGKPLADILGLPMVGHVALRTAMSPLLDATYVATCDKEIQDFAAKAGLPGSVMISDAFFPFRDGVDVGLKQGVACVVHPGGSLRDWESIAACNQADPPAAMVFTGQRAFKH